MKKIHEDVVIVNNRGRQNENPNGKKNGLIEKIDLQETESEINHSMFSTLAERAKNQGNKLASMLATTLAGIYRPDNKGEWAAGYDETKDILNSQIDDDL